MTMKTFTRIGKAQRQSDGTVILSTDTPCAQDGLALRLDGWNLGRAREGRVKASYNHHTSGPEDLPVALWENVRVEDGRGLVGDGPLFASEMYPLAAIAEKMWRHDPPFLDDVSVTFRVNYAKLGPEMKKDGVSYRESYEHELIEAAVVFLGADQNAGKGRFAEAVARGVITEEEAESMSEKKPDASDATPTVSYEEFHALKTEVEKLREGLETARADIDRLHEERTQAEPPAPPAAAPEPEIAEPAPEDRMREFRAELERQIALRTGRIPD